MKNYNTYKSTRPAAPDTRKIKDILFLLGVAIALGLGLALAAPVHGAGLQQGADGDITGTITVTGGNAKGITIELYQHDNSKGASLLSSTTTDANGVYHFPKQASTPGTAYYEIKVTGTAGMLAVWYSFPILYLSGQNFTVPSIEMADVALLSPQTGSTITLPGKISWQARRSGETFRLSVYEAGKLDKSVLDSGSLGMNPQYNLSDGSLAPGNYEAVVLVRDAVVGYGVSQAHFQFTVGTIGSTTGQNTPVVSGSPPETAPTATGVAIVPAVVATDTPQPTATLPPFGLPSLTLHLTADKTEVDSGGAIIFKLEITNNGSAVAQGVVVKDQLPAGVTVNNSLTISSVGQAVVNGNVVTAYVGDLNPNDTAVVTIAATLVDLSLSNVSNQASALYTGTTDAVLSNAYIAQVAQAVPPSETAVGQPTAEPTATLPPSTDPVETAIPTQFVQPTLVTVDGTPVPETPVLPAPVETMTAEPTEAAAAPATEVPTVASEPTLAPVAPTAKPNPTQSVKGAGTGGGSSQTPSAPIPQTGGSFPIMFAILLLAVTLGARYLRGQMRGRNGRRS